MRVFTVRDRHTNHVVVLFGSGLIGSAIEAALNHQAECSTEYICYPWTDDRQRRQELRALNDRLRYKLMNLSSTETSRRCSLIWAAGVSGFGSTPEDMARETGLLAEICRFAETF